MKKKIFTILPLVAGLWLFVELVIPILTSDTLTTAIQHAGPYGPLFIIGYVILSHIIAPLGGIPAFIVGVNAFGIYQTVFYVYIASMISAAINFFISRNFGRRLVAKLARQKTMREIDEFTDDAGVWTLILGRIFGIAFFEEISYAAGLTNLPFGSYMLITITASIIPHTAIAFFFRDIDTTNRYQLALFLGILFFLCTSFALFVKHRTKHHQ